MRTRYRWMQVGFWLTLGLWSVPAFADPGPSLQERLTNYVRQSQFDAAQWGIKIVEVDSGKVWFQHQSGKLMIPASNAKLFTGALALDVFGPRHRIATSLYAAQRPDASGTLPGDLIVFGRGDPTFSARFREGNDEGLLDELAETVVRAGIQRVAGDLIGDERYFRGAPYGMNWTWDDLQYYYGAEVSSLTVQDNVVDVVIKPGKTNGVPCLIEAKPSLSPLEFVNRTRTVGEGEARRLHLRRPLGADQVFVSGQLPVMGRPYTTAATVPRPARWFLVLLQEALERKGVQIAGDRRVVNWLESYPVDYTSLVNLGNVYSRPMSEMVSTMMKPSQNLYAQLLLLQCGAKIEGPWSEEETTEDRGLISLDRFLRKASIPTGEVFLEEGSGLSRGALVTPNALIGLLQHMWSHPQREAFLDALPVSGRDGTLSGRLNKPAVQGKVRAKTGTLRHVTALSGYLALADDRTLAFALMLNQFPGGRTAARQAVDDLVHMLAESVASPKLEPHPVVSPEKHSVKELEDGGGSPLEPTEEDRPILPPEEGKVGIP